MNSGERTGYIRSFGQVSMNARSLPMANPVLEPVEIIPVSRNSFPHFSAAGSFNSWKEYCFI
ncbi:MAG: hypothetical protein QM301_05315 [Bacteroidota bacterium]|jgi:hypothetical protein|nr:hypothetical protein [Bacteroidota bacterium]OQB79486.1 MAG: hypothetical protein BWX87_02060 [Bacteroidetes bacterium ADurb.Bin123]